MLKRLRPRSLTQRTLWRVALRIGLVVAIATVLSYWHVLDGLERQALEQLSKYVEQRRARESTTFELAQDNLVSFAAAFEARMAATPALSAQARFRQLFKERADGTLRLDEVTFKRYGITGFIGRYVEVDSDLRRRLVAAFDVLARYGPAWSNRFVNLYVITPENAILMYWPNQRWALQASDWEVHGKLSLVLPEREGVVVTLDQAIVDDEAQSWSDLYFDYGVNDWLVSVTQPVVDNGRHLLSAGHDILLSQLIERVIASEFGGTRNMLFDDGGRLIAHPRYMEAIQAGSGQLTIAATKDERLQRIFDLSRNRIEDEVIIENPVDEEFLAVTRLSGPGWYLVTAFPQAIVGARALDTAQLILFVGAAALLIEIGILFWVLRRQVAEPLRELIDATRRIASGHFDRALAVERNDEIGELAQSFNAMSEEVAAREAALNERSAELEHELKERARVEQEMLQQRDALYQSEKLNALGSLLAGVAHELNNPLSVVVARAFMLEQSLKETPHGDAVTQVRLAAERCAKIIKTFLAMARQQEPSREAVRPCDVVTAALEMVIYALRSDSIKVEVDVPESLPEIYADPTQLVQALTNLLINSQQALTTEPPPRRVRIEACLQEVPSTVVLRISDNGPGIPTEHASRVFEPFFTTKEVGKGTGLGLSVCRGLIKAHGGTIEVAASGKDGTTFEVRLPVHQPGEHKTDQRQAVAGIVGEHRILVVEDEPDIAEMLAEMLTHMGQTVEVAASGKAAIAKLGKADFDLVMTDLRMPDVDGIELFGYLQDERPEMASRVIFITGDSLGRRAADFLEGAARPVIEKPFTPEDVLRVLVEQLARDAARNVAGASD